MKIARLFFFLTAFLSATFVMAQYPTERGNFVIGTSVGLSANDSKLSFSSSSVNDKGDGPSSRQWNISPRIGYFLFDNFSLGIGLDYTSNRTTNGGADKTEDSDLLFGPYGRYYFPFGDDKAFFLEGNFGFGNATDNLVIGNIPQNITTNIIAIGGGPGFCIFSNDGLAIEAIFKYNYARSRFNTQLNGVLTETTTKTNQFVIALGMQFYFGGVKRYSSGMVK